MQPGQLTPDDQSNSPHHTMLSSTKKAEEGEGGGRGTFGAVAFVLPSNRYVCRNPAFEEGAEHLPNNEK